MTYLGHRLAIPSNEEYSISQLRFMIEEVGLILRREISLDMREVEILRDKDRYFLRSELRGCCFDALQAVGVAAPPTLRR